MQAKTSTGFSPAWPEAGWEAVTIPSNWDVRNAYANYRGKAWYRTSFQTPVMKNKRVFLSFEAISMSYRVYLNGKQIAHVVSGNTSETFDVTTLLLPDRRNVLAVLVDNTLFWGAYWNWGGIRRPVRLLIREPVYIERQQIVATPDLSTGTAIIKTGVEVRNTTSKPVQLSIQQVITGPTGSFTQVAALTLPARSDIVHVFQETLTKDQVRLWHFDNPALYTSQVSVTGQNGGHYQHRSRFGIRKVELTRTQLLLNGEPVRLAGYNWVADDRTTGNTLPEFRFKEDIDLMKAAGANMARLSHRPLPQDVMDFLDEKGILVFAEFNNWAPFLHAESEEPRRFATQLVRQNVNHPCIIGWSVGNEMGNQAENPDVNAYVASITRFIKTRLDSTRFVIYVSNTADFQKDDAAQYGDLVLINKYWNYAKGLDTLRKRYPDKPVFMSEYGSHTINLLYDTPDHTRFSSMIVDGFAGYENLIGYSLWTFNDYRSFYQSPDPKTTTPLHQNRQWGIVDVYRNKKRSFRQLQQFYAPVKTLSVSPVSAQGQPNSTTVTIRPRGAQDIPAYTLRGYRLCWEVRNRENRSDTLGTLVLPAIVPGSQPLTYPIGWQQKEQPAFLQLSLLSPTGTVVTDTVVHLIPPPAPTVTACLTASTQIRLDVEKNVFSTEYKLYYRLNGVVKSLPATIDHYAQVTNLPVGIAGEFWFTALNAAGESAPSTVYSYTAKAGADQLPPVIWLSEPADQSFFVGMSYHFSDNTYQIRYTPTPDRPESWQVVQSTGFGMMQVPNLKNGIPYTYQLRRSGSNNLFSVWTAPKTVTPNAAHGFGQAFVHGFTRTPDELIMRITSAGHANSYTVDWLEGNTPQTRRINQSVVEWIVLPTETRLPVSRIQLTPNY